MLKYERLAAAKPEELARLAHNINTVWMEPSDGGMEEQGSAVVSLKKDNIPSSGMSLYPHLRKKIESNEKH
jgi:hypothetical protein